MTNLRIKYLNIICSAFFGIITVISCLIIPSFAFAAIPADLQSAIDNAKAHAATPTSIWIPSDGSIVKTANPGTYGLIYTDSPTNSNLIVRSATRSAYWGYTDKAAGQTYTTYGTKGSAADWVTTGNDFTNFYDNKGDGATNTDLIKVVERGLGMNNTGVHNVILEYVVAPGAGQALNDVLMRATKNPDISKYSTAASDYGDPASFPPIGSSGMTDATAYNTFQTYYKHWKDVAYDSSNNMPWTQLGYTYFWGNGNDALSKIQGMSEFLVMAQTDVTVYGVYTTSSYIYTKNGGQYGNGCASFNITGACDSVWAGHHFQAGTKSEADGVNTITNSGDISGGQGLLVWSLNYNVTNTGMITGSTTNKCGIPSTSDIAILFEGDTTTYSASVPAPAGINALTNSGTISSPGTAVKIVNGNTTINNKAGGTISGVTAIDSSAGTGSISITNRGTITGGISLAVATPTTLDIGNTALTVNKGHLSSLTFTANSANDFGNITITDTTVDASSKVNVTIGGYIPNSTTFQVINNTGAGISAVPSTIASSSPIFTFSGDKSTNDLVLTASRANTYNSFASSSNASAAGSVLNTLAADNTATGDMVTVLGALDSLSSGSQIDQALNSLLPNTDNSAPQTTQATLDQFLSTVFAHLDAVKNVTTGTLKGMDTWTSGYGSYIHQDPMGMSNGYNATIWGTAIGYDFPAMDNLRAGLSGGFAQDFIRTKDSSARNDINSYQGTMYGSYARDAYYIDTAFSFAYNTYDASRHVAVGTIDRTAIGDYNGQQYSGYIGGGYKFTGKNIELTPLISFQYTHLRINSYNESDAGAANLKVDAEDYDVAQTGLGMKFGYPVTLKGGIGRLTPELKFKWLYDWVGDNQQATSAFTGGGGSFNTQGFTPAQSSYDFGAKLILETTNYITVSLSYDLELKEDFYGHNGLAEVRYRF